MSGERKTGAWHHHFRCHLGSARRALVFAKAPPGVKPGTEVMASASSAFAGARDKEVQFLCGAKVGRNE